MKTVLLNATEDAKDRVCARVADWMYNKEGSVGGPGSATDKINTVMEFLLNEEGVTMYYDKSWKATQD